MKKLFSILILSCLLLPAKAKDYYVTNITEYNKAVKQLEAGDSVTLSKGAWKDVQLVFHGEGTAQKPVTLRVEEYGKTTLEGLSSLQLYGEHLIVDGLMFVNGHTATGRVIEFRKGTQHTANNSILRNCVIDSYNQPFRMDSDAWVNLWGKNNEVSNCYFGGKTNLGVTLIVWPNGEGHKENFHRIKNNYFGARPRLGANGGETMRIGTSHVSKDNSNTIVEGNYFEHCNGEVEIISVKSCENKIMNNTFFECEGSVVLRHGDRNEVSGNFFLGNHKPSTGGIRVINEGQKVFNNYFYGLRGKDFRGPLVIMNGVPNSVLNRYHQVKDANISYNTWVDCELPWQLCVGSDEERSALPQNVTIANNIVYCPNDAELVKRFDDVKGFKFDNNLLIGKNGISKADGSIDGNIEFLKNSAYSFPLVGGKGIGSINTNGHQLPNSIPSAENTGPAWYKPSNGKEGESNTKVHTIKPGVNSLIKAIDNSKAGDTIELEDGEYINTKRIVIPHTLIIRSASVNSHPVVKGEKDANIRCLFELGSDLTLNLDGIAFDGKQNGKFVKYAIATAKDGVIASSYNIYINSCDFYNFKDEKGGAIYKAYKSSFADTLMVSNTTFRDSFRGFALNDEKDEKGFYSAEFMTFDNVVFKNITQWAMDFLRGGNDESTLGGNLIINHCVFDNVNNNENQVMIKHVGLVTMEIRNTIFMNTPLIKHPVRLIGRHNTLNNCAIYKAGKNHQTKQTTVSQNIITSDPCFRKNSKYKLEPNSPLKKQATDKDNIGLRE